MHGGGFKTRKIPRDLILDPPPPKRRWWFWLLVLGVCLGATLVAFSTAAIR